jgi:hypothetical protein
MIDILDTVDEVTSETANELNDQVVAAADNVQGLSLIYYSFLYSRENIFFADLSDAANEKATELENAAQGKSRYFAAKIFVFIDD